MIVTCESCAARYKLDESKIAGRGAKITCPRCRHVFVVYKEGARAPVAASGSGASVSSLGARASAPPSTPAPAPAAPTASRPPSTATASLVGDMPRPAASASLDGDPVSEAPGLPSAVDVHSLDFRRVGIHTWKVKIKIGLVYDFSDFRTLAKYIAEGRVGPTDKVSHDGKTWTDIGSLEALERHFIETYQRLDAEQQSAAAAAAAAEDEEEDFEDDEPTNIIGMGTGEPAAAASAVSLASFSSSAASRILPSGGDSGLAAATAAALQAESAPQGSSAPAQAPYTPQPEPEGSPRFVDPFEKRKRQRASRKPAPRPAPAPAPAPDAGNRNAVMGIAAIAVAGAAIWYFLLRTPDVVAPPARSQAAPVNVEPSGTNREDLREKILEDLEPVPEPELDEPTEEGDPWGVEAEPELRPVVPEHVRRGQAKPVRAPVRPASGGGGQSSTASDHVAAGDSAGRNGDWSTAAMAYRKAVNIDPRNAVYNGKLGMALRRAGDSSGALQPLSTAASGGYSVALRELGDLSADQGDTAGALGYYQRYLNTRPRDAAEVQRKIDRLNGG